MDKESLVLTELLDEPSFVEWMQGTASAAHHERWEQWLMENENNKVVAAKARKVISMPFKEVVIDSMDILNELQKFKNQASKLRLKKF